MEFYLWPGNEEKVSGQRLQAGWEYAKRGYTTFASYRRGFFARLMVDLWSVPLSH